MKRQAANAVTAELSPEDQTDLPRDRPFEPWRRAATARTTELVRTVVDLVEQREAEVSPRKRRRRPVDQQIMEDTVEALVCDAVHRELTAPGGRVMVPLSNQVLGTRSRYRAPVLSKALPHILDMLSGSVLEVSKGHRNPFGKALQTTVALTSDFRKTVQARAVSLQDIRRDQGGELIILKQAREDYWSGGTLLEYDDTPETNRYRSELERINAAIAGLDLDFDQEHPRASQVDLGDRALRRIFNNGRFDHGGRLYGGFWQALSKKDRAAALRLDGDVAVTLDYRQMGPRLLYARSGATPPADCYAVPGFEHYRSGWKKLLNAMLFAGPDLARLPKGTADLLPERIGAKQAVQLLLDHNAPIAPYIHRDVGFEIMFSESQLLVALLLELEKQEIAALPIHDAIIVPEHREEDAQEAMIDTFEHQTGLTGEVSREG